MSSVIRHRGPNLEPCSETAGEIPKKMLLIPRQTKWSAELQFLSWTNVYTYIYMYLILSQVSQLYRCFFQNLSSFTIIYPCHLYLSVEPFIWFIGDNIFFPSLMIRCPWWWNKPSTLGVPGYRIVRSTSIDGPDPILWTSPPAEPASQGSITSGWYFWTLAALSVTRGSRKNPEIQSPKGRSRDPLIEMLWKNWFKCCPVQNPPQTLVFLDPIHSAREGWHVHSEVPRLGARTLYRNTSEAIPGAERGWKAPVATAATCLLQLFGWDPSVSSCTGWDNSESGKWVMWCDVVWKQ